MTTKKRPRMIDVARLAGVSESTVSRALTSPDKISTEVVTRVLAAAKSLDYSVNPSARSLASNRAEAVLVLIPDIGSDYFSKVLKGIEQTARGLGLSVLIGEIGVATKPLERYLADIRAGRADGIILLAGHTVELTGFGRKIEDTPLVLIGAIDPKHQVTCISVDNFSGAYKATRYLLNLGHRRIGHVAGPLSSFEMKARRDGFLSAMADAGLRVPDEFIRTGDLQAQSGVRIGEELALMKDRPTAIFCANDRMAIGTMAGLRNCGLSVPSDISVVGFDDSELVALLNPPLTTVRQPSFEFGRQAMFDLHSLIAGEFDRPPTRILESELVIRESCSICPD